MTLDEAIKHAEEVAEQNEWFDKNCLKSMQCRECATEHRQLAEWLKDYKRLLEQQPCEDAVGRQAALASIKNLYPDMPIADIFGARRKWLEKYAPYFECENAIEQLLSVNPVSNTSIQKPKTGHWIWQTEDIYRCSECGNDIRVKEVMNIPQYVRCPMCEAKMVEPQESEV